MIASISIIQVLSALLAIPAVLGAPILSTRIVPISECKTVSTGTLKTSSGHALNFGTSGNLSFASTGLAVQFKSCQPNFGGYDGKNGRATGGHIYVPSTGKCISTDSDAMSSSGVPFTFTQETCERSDDSSQVFSNFAKDSTGNILYVGGTQADGSYKFYGDVCSTGKFGVKASLTSGTAKFHCSTDSGITGLKI